MSKANYRKINDRSCNSSTYHKKDGTNVRAILKRETLDLENNIVFLHLWSPSWSTTAYDLGKGSVFMSLS